MYNKMKSLVLILTFFLKFIYSQNDNINLISDKNKILLNVNNLKDVSIDLTLKNHSEFDSFEYSHRRLLIISISCKRKADTWNCEAIGG